MKAIYRDPTPEENKKGIKWVRNADGALFDGARFISTEGNKLPLVVMSEGEEEEFEEWLSRLGK